MAGYIGSKAVITSGVSASIDELNIIDGVTATTAELNIMDGVTSTAAELNILDGVTATAAELNIMDGVTSTAAELNIMDGVTATAAEINLIDGGTTRGTTTIADADGVLVNDAGTMRMTTMATLATYMGTKGLGPAYTRATTPPGSPNAGDWWLNTGRGNVLYIYDGTLGWLTNSNRTLGTGNFLPAGSFSVVFHGNLARVSYEGSSIGQTVTGFATVTNVSLKGEGSWALSNSTRGVFAGTNSVVNHMDYITMASNAASVDFGNLVVARQNRNQCTSHDTRGVIAGGNDGSGYTNSMDYITIASAGDATDFGNLSVARTRLASQAMSSTTRSIFHGGEATGLSTSDIMDYITIGTTGNATDFGNATATFYYGAGANSTTRGISAHGANRTQVIDYVTIGTTGNATDFGDLLAEEGAGRIAIHNKTIAYLNSSEQITIATAANSTASGYTMGVDEAHQASVMPGWIAANG
jgi:hypothetical protein